MLATIRCGGLSSEGRSGWRSVGQVDDLASHVLMQLLQAIKPATNASVRQAPPPKGVLHTSYRDDHLNQVVLLDVTYWTVWSLN